MNHLALKFTIALVCMLLLGSCAPSNERFRDQFRWLSGKWQGYDGQVLILENWAWQKHRFEGSGFNIIDKDTIMRERLFLVDYAGNVGYTVIVNSKGPFTFALKSAESDIFVFENEDHDFPSIIQYRKDSDSTMTVTLMSSADPNTNNTSYQLKRVL